MMSKLQLDGILRHRRTVSDKKAVVENSEMPPKKLLKSQKSVDFNQEKSKSPTPKRKSPEPPLEDPERAEEVQIPCEFCEVLVPFSRLLIHQVTINLCCVWRPI
jgi:hypothetical protein